MYSVAHGVPLILFKLKHLKARPKEVIIKYLNNIIRSMCFLGSYIMAIRLSHCYLYQNIGNNLPAYLLMSFLGSIASCLEETRRIDDYAVFTFPRVIDGLWYTFTKQFNLKDVPQGKNIIFCICMAMIFYLKKNHLEHLPSHYLKQFDFFFGS